MVKSVSALGRSPQLDVQQENVERLYKYNLPLLFLLSMSILSPQLLTSSGLQPISQWVAEDS